VQVGAKVFFACVLTIAITLPVPEGIIGYGRACGWAALGAFLIAVCCSMVQLAGEYWLLGEAGHRLKPYAEPMWRRFRAAMVLPERNGLSLILTQILKTGGYFAMATATLNPFPFTPGRMGAVAIWRSARLPGSMLLIVGLSCCKLAVETHLAFLVGR
jgi:hypothetical protein